MAEEQKIERVPVHFIVPLPGNVCEIGREEDLMLREDMTTIESQGINKIDPILLRKLTTEEVQEFKNKGKPVAHYMIVDGHSRWQAASEFNWNKIRAIITDMTLEDAREWNYKKNKVRGTVDPMREAKYFTDLAKTLTIEKIAQKFGLTEKRVDQILSRIKLTVETKAIIQHREIDFPMNALHYEILGSVKEPEKQEQLAKVMVEEKLSGREARVAKEALEAGLPQEKAKKVVKSVRREKLKPKETKALLKMVEEKPEEVDRLTSLPKEELMAEVEGTKIVRTPEEVEEVFEKVPSVSPTESFTCPCGCNYTLQIDWVGRKTEWVRPN